VQNPPLKDSQKFHSVWDVIHPKVIEAKKIGQLNKI